MAAVGWSDFQEQPTQVLVRRRHERTRIEPGIEERNEPERPCLPGGLWVAKTSDGLKPLDSHGCRSAASRSRCSAPMVCQSLYGA